MSDNTAEDHFQTSLMQIVQSSGEYFLVGDQVSDLVIDAVRKHTEFILTRLFHRLGHTKSITLRTLVQSFSDSPININRMYNYYTICSQQMGEEASENLDSLAADKSSMMRKFLGECEKHGITITDDPETTSKTVAPRLILEGQATRCLRIDEFAVQSTTADYIEFTLIRQKARLFGTSAKDKAFSSWLHSVGISLKKNECTTLLAYLVTQCVKDLIDVALANRQRFGINLLSQLTAVELQQAALRIRALKSEYL